MTQREDLNRTILPLHRRGGGRLWAGEAIRAMPQALYSDSADNVVCFTGELHERPRSRAEALRRVEDGPPRQPIRPGDVLSLVAVFAAAVTGACIVAAAVARGLGG